MMRNRDAILRSEDKNNLEEKLLEKFVVMEEEKGIIHVLPNTTISSVLDLLENEGSRVAKKQRIQMVEEELQNQLRVYTKRKLRLAGLLRKEDIVNSQKVIACCQRLQSEANRIAPLVHHMYLKISDRWFIDEDGTMEIPWNFQ